MGRLAATYHVVFSVVGGTRAKYGGVKLRLRAFLVLPVAALLLTGCFTGSVIIPLPTVTSVVPSCSASSILTNQTATCTSQVTGEGTFSKNVIWSVSPAGIGSVSGVGVFTPAKAGVATITATSSQDSSKYGSYSIAVNPVPTITSVSVSCTPSSILTSQTSACAPTVTGTGAFSSAIIWTVNPVSAGTVSSGGVFTPAGAGTATVTAISVQDPTKIGSATIISTPPITVTSVSVSCTPLSLLNSQTTQCSSNVQGAGNFDPSVSWYVNNVADGNSLVGTISAQGLYVPPDPLSGSSVVISAVSRQDATKQGSTNVSLSYPQPVVSGVSPTNLLWMGSTTEVQVTGSNFSRVSAVSMGGTSVPTTYVSSSQLTATVPATTLQTLGTVSVTVNTGGPGGGTSGNLALAVAGGALSISIQGLPTGATTRVQVLGPNGFNQTITSTNMLQGLAAGTYTIQATPGDDGKATYPAAQASQTAVVADLTPLPVSVNYATGIIKAVKYLDTAGTDSLAFVSGSQAFLVNQASAVGMSLMAGDVLVIPDCTAAPGGAIVRVVSSSIDYDQVMVVYEPGTFADLFTQLTFQISQEIGADQVVTAHALLPGATILSRARTVQERAALPRSTPPSPCQGNPLTIGFNDAQYAVPGTNGSVTVTGGLQLCPQIIISATPTSFSGVVQLNEQTHLAVTAQSSFSGGIPIADFKAVPIPIGPTGGLVNLVPEIEIDIDATGSLIGSVTLGATQTATEQFGLQYSNGQTTDIAPSPTVSVSPDPVDIVIDANASMKVALGAKLTFNFDVGLPPPLCAICVPILVKPSFYVLASADLTANPWYSVHMGVDADEGVDPSVFGFSFGSLSFHQNLWDRDIDPGIGAYAPKAILMSITPSPLLAQASGQSITLHGAQFQSGMTVKYCELTNCNTQSIPSPNSSDATFDAALNHSGTWHFQVMDPDGSTSAILPVTVLPPAILPNITSVSPSFLQAGLGSVQLTLTGSGFEPGMSVRLCRAICYPSLSGSQILSQSADGKQAIVLATLAASGSWTAQILNPDGGVSNSYPFVVQPGLGANVFPGTGIVGNTQFAITGVGATPNGSITRAIILPDGSKQNSTLTANASGAFGITFTATMPGPYVETFTDVKTGVQTAPLTYSAVTANAGSYTVSTSPSSLNVIAGNSTSFVLTASSSAGFAGTVALSPINVSGIGGVSGAWSPASIVLSPGGQGTSTYSLATSASTPAGTYTLTVQTSSGSLTANTTVTVVVSSPSSPGYNISIGNSSQTVTAGSSASFVLTATSTGGYAGVVSLTQPNPGISGASATWSPTSISVASGGQGTSTLTVATSSSTPVGTYSIPIQTTNGSVTQNSTVTLTVVGSVGPGLPTLTGFSINPSSVTSGAFATLTITLSGPAPSGGATITLQTNNGGLPLPPSYTVSAGQSSASFSAQSSTVLTQSTTTTVTATYAAGGGTRTANITVTLAVPATPTGLFPGGASAPGSTVTTATPVLSWSSSADAASYTVAAVDVATHATVFQQNTSTNSLVSPSLTNGHTYIWNVMATNSAGTSAPSTGVCFTVSLPLAFTSLTPQNVTTSVVGYEATMSAIGVNFTNLAKVYWTWSGTIPGSDTWLPGDTNWINKLTINSDSSLTLRPIVSASSDTPGTYTWSVTLTDSKGASKTQTFTVTFQ